MRCDDVVTFVFQNTITRCKKAGFDIVLLFRTLRDYVFVKEYYPCG